MDNGTKVSISDFTMTVNLIDICTERGAFKGNELLAVGSLREKFAAFVKENSQNGPENTPIVDEIEDETE
jgi:hypothetical protein